jgi:galactonate dehydratase
LRRNQSGVIVLKITDVTTFLAGERKGGHWRNWLFVKVETSNGLVGYGEGSLESREKTVEAAVLELKRYLVGKDPTEIERHWQAMYRGTFWKGGPVLCSAISAVEQALWDILGKSLGCPVYKLLGGPCRDKVKAYTHVSGLTPEELARNAKGIVVKGYKALKFLTDGGNSYTISGIPSEQDVMKRRPIKETVARVAAVRKAVGDKVDLMLDAHGRLDPSTATILAKELEPYNLLFFEEPIQPENFDMMSWVCAKSNVPIATGERIYTKFGFNALLEKHDAQIIQPDVCHAGGILECKKIAAMAECYYVSVAPHNPNSPVATAASIHLAASIPNFLIQEMIPADTKPRKALLKPPLKFEDGYLKLPRTPGLGFELNEDLLQTIPYAGKDIPNVYYEDGSVADW